MYKSITLASLAAVSMLLAAGCTNPQTNAALNNRINELEAEIKQLKASDQGMINLREFFDTYYQNGQISESLVYRYMKSLELPADPTPEQVKDYLQKISKLNNYNYRGSIQGEITEQLGKLDHSYLEVLIPYIGQINSIQNTVRKLVTKEDRPLILKYLKGGDQQMSYQLVEIYKGIADASDREFLLEILPKNPNLLSALSDCPPEMLLPIVTAKLLNDNNFNNRDQWLSYALKNLDDEARTEFLKKYWRGLRETNRSDRSNMTYVALQLLPYGFKPAFTFMAMNLQLLRNDNYRMNQFLSFTPSSSEGEFKQWYDANADDIVFDDDIGIFIVPKSKK